MSAVLLSSVTEHQNAAVEVEDNGLHDRLGEGFITMADWEASDLLA